MADDRLAGKVRALAREWGRLADRYDAQANAQANALTGVPSIQLRAWAQAYRNASAFLGMVIRPVLAASPRLSPRRNGRGHE